MAVVETLTGKIRYRVQERVLKKPLIVLQVEVHLCGTEYADWMGGWHDVDCKEWRDARVEDLEAVWSR